MKCPNCGKPCEDEDHKGWVFEGVQICSECNKMVKVLVRRNKIELAALETLYRDRLRKALLEGKLRPRAIKDEDTSLRHSG